MQILKPSQKKYMVANQTITNHILKHTKSIQTVDMVTRLCVVMIINTRNQYKFTEVKKPFTNSWKQC